MGVDRYFNCRLLLPIYHTHTHTHTRNPHNTIWYNTITIFQKQLLSFFLMWNGWDIDNPITTTTIERQNESYRSHMCNYAWTHTHTFPSTSNENESESETELEENGNGKTHINDVYMEIKRNTRIWEIAILLASFFEWTRMGYQKKGTIKMFTQNVERYWPFVLLNMCN